MKRALVAIAVLLLLAACGGEKKAGSPDPKVADMGANPQAQETPRAPASYQPPAGRWKLRSDEPAPSQWYEEYAAEKGATVLRVNVFPVRSGRDPSVTITRAVDIFVRSLGTDGVGFRQRGTRDVWGARGAEAAFSLVRNNVPLRGHARLILARDDMWAFAVGVTADDAPPAEHDVVEAFAKSLEPATPIFYARRFRSVEDMQAIVARAEGEPNVVFGHVMAVELVLEAGVGTRFPLATRSIVHEALRADAQAKLKQTRDAYRETHGALEKSKSLDPAVRLRGMRALGQRVLQALLERATAKYGPAVRYAGVWKRLRELALGSKDDGLTVGAAQCLHEMSAFLASLAADREVPTNATRSDRIVAALKERWSGLGKPAKEALRGTGTAWAGLRQAWDEAEPAARIDFRRAVALALAPADPPKEAADVASERDLMSWMRSTTTPEALDALVMRAAALAPGARADLLDVLAKPTPSGWELGW